MEELIYSIEKCLESELYWGALFQAVCIPDILGKCEYGNEKKRNEWYELWFENNIPHAEIYKKHLTGSDAYAIRCAVLHDFSKDLSPHQARKRLHKFHFSDSTSHLNTLENTNGDGKVQCMFSAQIYSRHLVAAYRKWVSKMPTRSEDIRARFADLEKSGLTLSRDVEISPGFIVHTE